MKRKVRKVLSLLLCLAVIIPLVPCKVSAAGFSDVNDKETARNVAVLRLMGVVGGNSDGLFHPSSSLTRAEFCKMAVTLMGKADEVVRYRNRIIFPDVRSTHWAAGYINFAAAYTSNGETVSVSTSSADGTTSRVSTTGSTASLVHGLPDGTFAPDRAISYAEAITILLRILGYDDKDADCIWPDGYLQLAKEKELTKGIVISGNDTISRAQAAKLFVNALTAKISGIGQEYVSTLGIVSGEVTLMSVDLATGKMITTEPTTNGSGSQSQTTHEYESTTDEDGNIQIQSRTESQYSWNSSYASNSNNKMTYNYEQLEDLSEFIGLKGRVVTKNGKVLTFLPSTNVNGGAIRDAAIIISADGSTAGFDGLTGGVTNYTIYRNGRRATRGELKKNDVAIYNASSNAVIVCDTRVSAFYEACDVSPNSPTVITTLGGTRFHVLPTAQQSVAKFKPGDTMILMMTADGQIAGAASLSEMRPNAYAYVDDSGKVNLICGGTLVSLACTVTGSNGKVGTIAQDRLVKTDSPEVHISALTGGPRGVLDLASMKLGTRDVAANVMIINDGKLLMLGEMTEQYIPSERITFTHLDASGLIDIIVARDRVGNAYYGRAILTEKRYSGGGYVNFTDVEEMERFLSVEYGNGKATKSIHCDESFRDGVYVEAIMSVTGDSFIKVTELTQVNNVRVSNWIGKTVINYDNHTYMVSDSVVCRNLDTWRWFDSLDEALEYDGIMKLYVKDDTVRVIEVSAK